MERIKKSLILLIIFSIFFVPAIASAKTNINEEMMYKILVDRFNIGEQQKSEQVRIDDPYAFHGGDLKGVSAKLGEIEALGYTAISLSSMMKNAPDGYHGYWIEDFFEIDEEFGSMEQLHKVTKDAEKRNIKIILELALNFVADSHPFVGDEEKSDWLIEVDIPLTDSTYWLENVFQLDQDNPDVQEYLLSVIEYWMDETDVAGFNLHAVEQMSPDFLEKLVDFVNEKEDSFYLFGTILDETASRDHLAEYADDILIENYAMHNAMLEVFSEVGNPVEPIYDAWEQSTGEAAYMFVDDEHSKRFSQLVAENGRNPATAWKLALTYMYTAPGVPVILQGSEFSMFGEGFPETQRLVPFHSADQELEQFFYRIASLKKEFPALRKGSFELVDSSGAMSVFKRTYEDEAIYIAINNDEKSQTINVEEIEEGKRLRGIMEDNLVVANDDGSFTLGIPRETVEIYLIEEDVGINWLFISFVGGIFLLFIIAVIYLSIKQKARSK